MSFVRFELIHLLMCKSRTHLLQVTYSSIIKSLLLKENLDIIKSVVSPHKTSQFISFTFMLRLPHILNQNWIHNEIFLNVISYEKSKFQSSGSLHNSNNHIWIIWNNYIMQHKNIIPNYYYIIFLLFYLLRFHRVLNIS